MRDRVCGNKDSSCNSSVWGFKIIKIDSNVFCGFWSHSPEAVGGAGGCLRWELEVKCLMGGETLKGRICAKEGSIEAVSLASSVYTNLTYSNSFLTPKIRQTMDIHHCFHLNLGKTANISEKYEQS